MNIEETDHNIIKAIYNKPTANIIVNGEKLKAFSLRSEVSQVCQLSSLSFNIVWKSRLQQSEKKKKYKESRSGKK